MTDTYDRCHSDTESVTRIRNSINNTEIIYQEDGKYDNGIHPKKTSGILITASRTLEAAGKYTDGSKVALLGFANNPATGGAPGLPGVHR